MKLKKFNESMENITKTYEEKIKKLNNENIKLKNIVKSLNKENKEMKELNNDFNISQIKRKYY